MGFVDQPEDVILPEDIREEFARKAEAAELHAVSVKAHLENLRDRLKSKADELAVQEKFSARGDKSVAKAELTKEVRSLLAEAGDSIRKVSGDRGE